MPVGPLHGLQQLLQLSLHLVQLPFVDGVPKEAMQVHAALDGDEVEHLLQLHQPCHVLQQAQQAGSGHRVIREAQGAEMGAVT